MKSYKSKLKERKGSRYVRAFATPRVPMRLPKSMRDELQKELEKIVKTNTNPERVKTFVDKVIDKAAKGKSHYAAELLKQLAKPLAVKTGEAITRLVLPPEAGATSPSGTAIPMTSGINVHRISGANKLYTAHEHVIKFTSGSKYGRWMKEMMKTHGTSSVKDAATDEQYLLDDPERDLLTKYAGANQKIQLIPRTAWFGYSSQSFDSAFPNLFALQSSHMREQVAYGAISNLISNCTVTSLNKYFPIYLKVHLVALKNTMVLPRTLIERGSNASIITQDDGAMPLYCQQDVFWNDNFTAGVHVDPKSKGVLASVNFKEMAQIIETRKVKLAAGDRCTINYNHMLPSGLKLDRLYAIRKENDVYAEPVPITYFLMLEAYGEECDVYSATDNANVIKATAPLAIQMEFSRYRKGVRPETTATEAFNSASYKGWLSNDWAVKVYTKSPIKSGASRWFGDYSKLNTGGVGGYYVPVMSDAAERDAGQVR